MSLDITFTSRSNVICPHCKKVVGTEDVYSVNSGGRSWYEFLEELGYYVPYEERTEENDWYGKDMVLTKKQAEQMYAFLKRHTGVYNQEKILGLIATTLFDENMVVINADW